MKKMFVSVLWRVLIRLGIGAGIAYWWQPRVTENTIYDSSSILFLLGILLLALAFWRYRRADEGLSDYAGTRWNSGGLFTQWAGAAYHKSERSSASLDEYQIFLCRQLADIVAAVLFMLPSLLSYMA